MKLTLTFEKKDFENLRKFGDALKRQVGDSYAGTDSFSCYFEYPAELKALLRPSSVGSVTQQELLKQLETGSISFEVTSSKLENKL